MSLNAAFAAACPQMMEPKRRECSGVVVGKVRRIHLQRWTDDDGGEDEARQGNEKVLGETPRMLRLKKETISE